MTPRQTCPRPNGLGRNLRSKTRWFAGFCNSHQVSHFATFFIDARAEISVAESRCGFSMDDARPRAGAPGPGPRRRAVLFGFLGAARAGVFFRCPAAARRGAAGRPGAPGRRGARGRGPSPPALSTGSRVVLPGQVSTMILPQVHLRKPCYDFSFL